MVRNFFFWFFWVGWLVRRSVGGFSSMWVDEGRRGKGGWMAFPVYGWLVVVVLKNDACLGIRRINVKLCWAGSFVPLLWLLQQKSFQRIRLHLYNDTALSHHARVNIGHSGIIFYQAFSAVHCNIAKAIMEWWCKDTAVAAFNFLKSLGGQEGWI